MELVTVCFFIYVVFSDTLQTFDMELQITEATHLKYARNTPKLMQMHRTLAILLLFAYAIEILGYLLTALLPCSNLTPAIEKSLQREKL